MKSIWSVLYLGVFVVAACGDDAPAMDAGLDTSGDTSVIDAGQLDASDAAVSDVAVLDASVFDMGSPDLGQPCDPGETRTVACERCGTAPQACGDDAMWMAPGDCFNAGVCESGEVEEERLEMCSTRRRLCLDSCEWSDWNDGDPIGACEPGAVEQALDACENPSEVSTRTCQEDCHWTATDCELGCTGTRRTIPMLAEEICIPAGVFIRGEDDFSISEPQPEARVELSSFYIDRYPVTKGRYTACVLDEICTITRTAERNFREPYDLDESMLQVTWGHAMEFCRWDGGRRLVSSNEWEKAARGPAPREGLFVWDGDAPTCSEFPGGGCPDPGLIRVYDLPAARSYYGVDYLIGSGYEVVIDSAPVLATGMDAVNYQVDSLTNVVHGYPLRSGGAVGFIIGWGRVRTSSPAGQAFRCGRSAPGTEREWEALLP